LAASTLLVLLALVTDGPVTSLAMVVFALGCRAFFRHVIASPPSPQEPLPSAFDDDDRLKQWEEVQDRLYDPGYWLGGMIHPLLRIRGRNPYGYMLILTSLFTLTLAAGAHETATYAIYLPFSALLFVAGVKLVQRPPRRQ
jgi:hypothetical protein